MDMKIYEKSIKSNSNRHLKIDQFFNRFFIDLGCLLAANLGQLGGQDAPLRASWLPPWLILAATTRQDGARNPPGGVQNRGKWGSEAKVILKSNKNRKTLKKKQINHINKP